jgi:phosphate-selective porin OprO and OprP
MPYRQAIAKNRTSTGCASARHHGGILESSAGWGPSCGTARLTVRFSLRIGAAICAELLLLVVLASGTGMAQEPQPILGSPPSSLEIVAADQEDAVLPAQGADLPSLQEQLQELQLRLQKMEQAMAGSQGSGLEGAAKGVQPQSPTRTPGAPISDTPATSSASGPKQPSGGAKSKVDENALAGDWVDVSSEKWNVRMGGHIQMDFVTWASASPSIPDTLNYFNFRRLRLLADGTGYGVYDFRLQMTLEPEAFGDNPTLSVTTPQVKDAYLSMNEIPGLGRLRIGNFFVPFGLEQVTNDTMNVFLERSIPTQGVFTADREVGIALYNSTPSQNVAWATGFFIDSINEAAKKRFDDNQGYRASGRISWIPLYDEPSQGRYVVYTGAGVLHTDDHDDRVSLRARPQVSEGPRLMNTGAMDVDHFTTANIESAVVWGPVTIQSEAYLSTLSMIQGGSNTANGAYVHATYFVTGENRFFERFGQHGTQFGRTTPFSNFHCTRGGWSPGALELKARWSRLDLNQLDSGQYNDLTVGFNWYWNDRTRWMFDWIHPITSDTAVFGATQSNIIGSRFDFNW